MTKYPKYQAFLVACYEERLKRERAEKPAARWWGKLRMILKSIFKPTIQ
jgi:hypothetical protein